MKKKLLSLVLAGAMVASTSVSAFAETTITKPDTQEPTTNIEITGEVYSDGDKAPAGTFKVTVPTATSFTVKADGTFVAPDAMTIVNNGTQDIDVYADKFVDTTIKDGITVDAEETVKAKNRTYVSLKLTGYLGTAYLKTENTEVEGKNGIYKNKELVERATDGVRLVNIQSGQRGELKLNGTAGVNQGDLNQTVKESGTTDSFTLTLKIKKAAKPANSANTAGSTDSADSAGSTDSADSAGSEGSREQ